MSVKVILDDLDPVLKRRLVLQVGSIKHMVLQLLPVIRGMVLHYLDCLLELSSATKQFPIQGELRKVLDKPLWGIEWVTQPGIEFPRKLSVLFYQCARDIHVLYLSYTYLPSQ